jgi:glycine dehydrogenase
MPDAFSSLPQDQSPDPDSRVLALQPLDTFARRHIGPSETDVASMLKALACGSLDQLIERAIPASIRIQAELQLPNPVSEGSTLKQLKQMAAHNQVWRSFIGMGYHDCLTPTVIQRNILENPAWYTPYTPYQAEIAQGRLEALFNYQTMVSDLTGLDLANASLLDEATAAAEAMILSFNQSKRHQSPQFWVAEGCHPQTLEVLQTRAEPLGIQVVLGDPHSCQLDDSTFGILLSYPTSTGAIEDYAAVVEQAHQVKALVIVAADLLSLTLLKPPGDWGADIAVGSTQRFGIPLGFGGPHAAYFATRSQYTRQIPGRIVGLSQDAQGNPALRLALQTREQHIRRDKATSNICTAQVLLAVMASMYAVYHGPQGLKAIADRIYRLTTLLKRGLLQLGQTVDPAPYFDTLVITVADLDKIQALSHQLQINLRILDDTTVGLSLNETTTLADIDDLLYLLNGGIRPDFSAQDLAQAGIPEFAEAHPALSRTSQYLTNPVFNSYHSETELLRYIHRLQSRDLGLVHSMMPLGSCTMKLNATTEMLPVSWPEFAKIHPFAPLSQAQGYLQLFEELEQYLAEITGFAGISLQPNAGSQGEYAGLLVIRAYHLQRGDTQRTVCLIPTSAHGTNPASAVMAGMKVVAVACDSDGNIDLNDLRAKAEKHRDQLAALMVTYPSTHGVFEAGIREICQIVHAAGGQVYLDGANLNAQVGLCKPGEYGADVCHLNLHKTFCIPHGGGGPGVGPIGVATHLVPFLPGHRIQIPASSDRIGAVAAAPWGSAGILPISWAYITLMGSQGLTQASQVAILNANYIAQRLEPFYPVLYKGSAGLVAHECILDLRPMKKSAGIEVEDVAKRLMDYGFHAPTMSWPVAGTMMVEPTESESKAELDRFCDAMIAIRAEIREIELGGDPINNLLKNAPHTAAVVTADQWDRPYSRQSAAYPAEWTKDFKFWPTVSRIDNAYGDRHLVCSCPPMSEYEPDLQAVGS